VTYGAHEPPYKTTSRHGPTHVLRFERLKKNGDYMTIAEFSCAAPGWRAWGLDDDREQVDMTLGQAVEAMAKRVEGVDESTVDEESE
jgi:hypothetical protein